MTSQEPPRDVWLCCVACVMFSRVARRVWDGVQSPVDVIGSHGETRTAAELNLRLKPLICLQWFLRHCSTESLIQSEGDIFTAAGFSNR